MKRDLIWYGSLTLVLVAGGVADHHGAFAWIIGALICAVGCLMLDSQRRDP
jgi:hypothetical protein